MEMIGWEPVEIVAGRLQLRPFLPSDADAVFVACQDPDIQRWTMVPVPYRHVDAERYVAANSALGWEDGRGESYAITDATSGELLGSIKMAVVDGRDSLGEVAWWIAPGARNQGIATQATRAVTGWAFEELGLARIQWLAAVGNKASRRVAEKAGFTMEGLLRDRLRARDGTRVDAWIGSLLPRDLTAGST